ncbi:MAG: hypothetical protein M3Y59_12590 [Myxococcota bacterium]|nr:hypothetical protein [Myxococcota bacterium]
MRPSCAVVALLVLTGCPGGEEGPCPITSSFASTPSSVAMDPSGASFLSPGPVSLRLHSPGFGLCPSGRQTFPEAVEVTVWAPDGSLLPSRSETNGFGLAVVEIQADTPGWYHLEANFLPSYGLAQQDFLVSRPLVATSTTTLGARCQKVDRTTLGTWICDQRVFRGTELADSLTEPFARWVSGAQVWTVALGRVNRFTDTGSGPLVLNASGTLPPQTILAAAGMGEDGLIVRNSGQLLRLEALPDGGISQTHSAGIGFGSAVHVEEGRVLLDEFGDRLQVYRPDPADAGFIAVGSGRGISTLMGTSAEGIWSGNPETIRLFAPGPGGVVARGASSVPQDLALQSRVSGLPVLSPVVGGAGLATFRMTPGGLEVVHLVDPPFVEGLETDYGWRTISSDQSQVLTW